MIPPLLIAIAKSILFKKVGEIVVENGAAALFPKPKLEPRVNLQGKKTYIGILVMLAAVFLPQLGLTEGQATEIVTAVGTAVGGIVALYGRWDASRRVKK